MLLHKDVNSLTASRTNSVQTELLIDKFDFDATPQDATRSEWTLTIFNISFIWRASVWAELFSYSVRLISYMFHMCKAFTWNGWRLEADLNETSCFGINLIDIPSEPSYDWEGREKSLWVADKAVIF